MARDSTVQYSTAVSSAANLTAPTTTTTIHTYYYYRMALLYTTEIFLVDQFMPPTTSDLDLWGTRAVSGQKV